MARELHSDLAGAYLESSEDDSVLVSSSFNLGSLVFLPKKVSGVDPLFGDYFYASDVRPLCIVNTDNRIIANAVRHKLEPFLNR